MKTITIDGRRSNETIRFSDDGGICIIDDGEGNFRVATQDDMDTLPVGDDLEKWEIESLDE